ncbi:unnamed protein product [Durusdinium trenchii]|uniref:Uncharacterized protein n=1 Tax=Durusdinium trenchii TaxID=1381693 RepID=A0ABP0T1X2_9DINO
MFKDAMNLVTAKSSAFWRLEAVLSLGQVLVAGKEIQLRLALSPLLSAQMDGWQWARQAAEFLLAKVQNFQKHDAAFQEKEEYSPVVTHKQLLQTLRTFDPLITNQQLEWVLGKEHTSGSSLVSLEELWADLQEGDFEVDPVELSFDMLSDQNQEFLDLEKVREALTQSGISGLTDEIMSKAIRRIRDLARENVRDARGKKKEEVDFRDYRTPSCGRSGWS